LFSALFHIYPTTCHEKTTVPLLDEFTFVRVVRVRNVWF